MTDSTPERRGKGVILLIVGIPLAVLLAASGLWVAVDRGQVDLIGALGTANHGELVSPPKSMLALAFRDAAGRDARWADEKAQWTILLIQNGDCNQACWDRLYQTRQIHTALGREAHRVGRVIISDRPLEQVPVIAATDTEEGQAMPATLSEVLAQSHPRVRRLEIDRQTLLALAPETQVQTRHWYLVDPAGWLMMRLSDELYFKDALDDLRFLLKYSPD